MLDALKMDQVKKVTLMAYLHIDFFQGLRRKMDLNGARWTWIIWRQACSGKILEI